MAEQIRDMLEELQADENIEIRSEHPGWSMTLSALRPLRPTTGRRFTYRGDNLLDVVRRAWAGEPPDEERQLTK